MDLSQVMLKLHGGKYDDPDEFGADIKLIFDNWKLYCKDPKRHYQVRIRPAKVNYMCCLTDNGGNVVVTLIREASSFGQIYFENKREQIFEIICDVI